MTPHPDGQSPETLAALYREKMSAESAVEDSGQRALVERLVRLDRDLAGSRHRGGLAGWIFGGPQAPRGLYIHGPVGRGKTMVMDAFFAASREPSKRRIHFNAFMGDVQDRLHAARQSEASDPIPPVATAIAAEARLLCLDEFSVTDIADAMILSRLFSALFERGVVLVATSNSAPEDLYRDGLNRALFVPFIAVLRKYVDVFHLDGGVDYRLAKLADASVYVTPLGQSSRSALDHLWRRLTGTSRGVPIALRTHGRDIAVPEAVDGVARFSFASLCEAPLAANDYLEIARTFHTVMVDDVPVIDGERRDVARRLILLVDTLYDHHVNLIVSAAAEPTALYDADEGEEARAFERTASRLIEMRSAAYLGSAHGASPPSNPALAPQHQSG